MSSTKLYYIHNGIEQQGPFTIEELKLKNVDLSTPIWFEGLNDWSTVGEIDDLKLILLNQPIENTPKNQITIKNKIKLLSFLESKKIGLILLLFSILTILLNIFEYFDGLTPKLVPIITWFSIIGCICAAALIIVTSIKKKLKLTYIFGLILFGASVFSIKIIEIEYRTKVTSKWMKENLNVDRFRNGDLIPEAKSPEDWNSANLNKQPIWAYYDYKIENGEKYGKLYNWYAVTDSRELAPQGWRVANSDDWWQLVLCWGGLESAGSKLKNSTDWEYLGNKLNISGFSALPGGMMQEGIGIPALKGYAGYWWVDDRNETKFIPSQCEFFHI